MEGAKDNKEFDTMIRHEQKNTFDRAKSNRRELTLVNTAEIHMNKEDAKHMARDTQDMGRRTILRKYAEARADRPLQMTLDEELFMTCAKTIKKWVATQEFDVSKIMFSPFRTLDQC